jgi:hypothetical protein
VGLGLFGYPQIDVVISGGCTRSLLGLLRKNFHGKKSTQKTEPNNLNFPSFPEIRLFIRKETNMENDVQKTYKRQSRAVPTQVRKKISDSLKSYNQNHPRGKASDGSQWSQNISNGLRADTGGYWSHIEPVHQDGETGMANIME